MSTNMYTCSGGAVGAGGTITVSSGGAGASAYTIAPSSTWDNALQVKGDVRVDGGDVIIDGVSLKEMMQSIAARMAILTVDPSKLEKFNALKQAYDHYKLMEALCHEDKKPRD